MNKELLRFILSMTIVLAFFFLGMFALDANTKGLDMQLGDWSFSTK